MLLCENNRGYENLCKLVSLAWTEGFYGKPRVDWELLERYHEGLIALSACLAGRIPQELLRGNYEEAKRSALRYQQIFGKENFFLELQDHGIEEQKRVAPLILKLAQETGIPAGYHQRRALSGARRQQNASCAALHPDEPYDQR